MFILLQLHDLCYSVERPVDVVVRDMAAGAGGLGFDYRAVQIGHSVVNGSPPLRCFFGAALPRR